MRKLDVVTKIADATGIPKADVLITLEAFIKEVKSQIVVGGTVYIKGFGSFLLKNRKAKVGRLINAGKSVVIPEHHVPAFKPSKSFTKFIKDNTQNIQLPGPKKLNKKPKTEE